MVIDEAVVRRPVGDAQVMAEQVRHIIDVMSLANVTVQVVPFELGAHPGLDGKFSVLRFAPDQALRDTVYIEGLLGELFLDKDTDVDRYVEIFEYLAQVVALDESRSRSLLERLHAQWLSSR